MIFAEGNGREDHARNEVQLRPKADAERGVGVIDNGYSAAVSSG